MVKFLTIKPQKAVEAFLIASSSTFNMKGGEISSNSGATGGAIYNVGEFNMSGPAYIPYGDSNDVMHS